MGFCRTLSSPTQHISFLHQRSVSDLIKMQCFTDRISCVPPPPPPPPPWCFQFILKLASTAQSHESSGFRVKLRKMI